MHVLNYFYVGSDDACLVIFNALLSTELLYDLPCLFHVMSWQGREEVVLYLIIKMPVVIVGNDVWADVSGSENLFAHKVDNLTL